MPHMRSSRARCSRLPPPSSRHRTGCQPASRPPSFRSGPASAAAIGVRQRPLEPNCPRLLPSSDHLLPMGTARSVALCGLAASLQRRLHLLPIAGQYALVHLAVLQLAHDADAEVAGCDRIRLRVVRLLLRSEVTRLSAMDGDFCRLLMLMRKLPAAIESGFGWWCASSYICRVR